ncbi:RRP40 [Candida pseudojiufengensis]|uniref:RRP40 n=1 Tax=Candida pseudojiufengensis TaxID=497109 RepID=UPI002224442F|nr:RRP40 [Candida pseudojiufengensis]KAI5966312.1 RRP40 [Candida pseudojiufengensis]
MSIIIPGDKLPIETQESTTKTTIGPGIYKIPRTSKIIPTTAGYLEIDQKYHQNSKLTYIESKTKRYIPHNNDFVIGTIVGTIGEYYKVNLQNFSSSILLNFFAFPNTNKKNRPNLKNGQVIYGRIVNDDNDSTFETEIECFDGSNNKESGGFGILDDSGYIFNISMNFARELLYNSKSPVLELLAQKLKFEIAIGINGKIWLKCDDGLQLKSTDKDQMEDEDEINLKNKNLKVLKETIAAVNYIKRCERTTPDNFEKELKLAFKGI